MHLRSGSRCNRRGSLARASKIRDIRNFCAVESAVLFPHPGLAAAQRARSPNMDTAIRDEAHPEEPVDLDQAEEPGVVEDEADQQEDLLAEDEPPPAPDVLPPVAPTAEEKVQAEREKERRRFEARRAGRMYFVRHPRAPEDPGAAQLPTARLCAWLQIMLC